jgi:hypothetical protein
MASAPDVGGSAAAPLPASAVQDLVDRAAHFNMFSIPDPRSSGAVIRASSGAVIGVDVREALHRFTITTQPPAGRIPLTATSVIGERAGTFTHRWLFTPADFVASPRREPPPTRLDPSVSQRFVMLAGTCTFGDGADGFRSFGAGRTLPATVNGEPQLLATAIGTILEGFGKFKGHEEGTFVYCGTLVPRRGFTGNVLLRVMDPQETFRADRAIPSPSMARRNPEPEITYLIVGGQAVESDPVTPRVTQDGRSIGLIVEQSVRLLGLDFTVDGPGGLQSTATIGPSIGRITARVTFDPTAAPGTALHPIPFTSSDEFVFVEREGGPSIGGVTADSSEGRVFHTQLHGQPAIRFGGIGQVLGGTGLYQSINGIMTDNSVVVFTPHVSASVYVLRIYDPPGRFRDPSAPR